MNRRVTFKTLWLISEKQKKARKQPFSPTKTLLLGKNGTGKSRVTKNLYYALGATPQKLNVGLWDPETVSALEFSYNFNDYLVIHSGKLQGIFSREGLLFSSSNASAWTKFISNFFGYKLQMQRPNQSRFSQAGMDYLTLPFYLDQDGSWGTYWNTYTSLTQFKDWKKPVFESFIGLRPNAYFGQKQLRDEVANQIQEKQKEFEAQRSAFKKVEDYLPKNLPSLHMPQFRVELAAVGREALKTQQKQLSLRSKLIAAMSLKQKIRTELEIVENANKELIADLVYISDHSNFPDKAPKLSSTTSQRIRSTDLAVTSDFIIYKAMPEFNVLTENDNSILNSSVNAVDIVECPTCGTVHENSFHAKVQLSEDIESLDALKDELENRLVGVCREEATIRIDIKSVEKSLSKLDEMMQEKKSNLRLGEVIAAHSKKTLNTAFHKITSELSEILFILNQEENILNEKLKKYTDAKRVKEVNSYFASQVKSISQSLNIPPDEQIQKPKPQSRAHTGGSSAPRSMLAVHLAMMKTNVEFGDSPCFPFVVDTPQQSGQDDINLRSMIDELGRQAGDNHQVILAVEKLPDNIDTNSFQIIHFDEVKSVLKSETYIEALEKLEQPLRILRAKILSDSLSQPLATS
ncbi:hypothetical protein Meth11DRAFT_2004 [Methylophilaceae bacterium 11]|nr:hypothetical protein Meth11DRAFT_2004 [Methylophilaceae bacterium 11]